MRPPPSVLIVDDADDTRELYALALERAGMRVVHARSISDALRLLGESSVDVLVTDYELPDGNGLAMIDVAAYAGLLAPEVPAVLCTGCGRIGRDSARLLSVFTKPVDVPALVQLIEHAVGGRRSTEVAS